MRGEALRPREMALAFGGYGLCYAVTVGFSFGFAPFQELTLRFGPAAAWAAPIALLAGLAALLGAVAWRRHASDGIGWGWLAGAAVLAVACLLFLDPRFPAKRIHVAEYMTLSFIVAAVTRRWVKGHALAAWSAALTALYGFHDEMLQGLLPDRTFGLDELLVDAASGLAGGMILLGLRLAGPAEPGWRPAIGPGLAGIVVGALLLAFALPAFREVPLPPWAVLPLLGGVLLWAAEDRSDGSGPVAPAFVLLATLLVVYPMLPHVLPLHFR